MGFRPPYVVKRAYKWTYLYAAVEPTSGESFCMSLPGMDQEMLRYSWMNSQRDTPMSTSSSCSTAHEPSLGAHMLPG